MSESNQGSTVSRIEVPDWPYRVYRRYLVDMHVPDWDAVLLSRFNAREYVDHIAKAGMQSLLQYANSHVGLCLWGTKIGKRHAAMGGGDFFGDVVGECHRRGIHPLAYFSVIHDNWAFENHPDWRIIRPDGSVPGGRYGYACPNSPYRDYVFECIREIVEGYSIDGIFFDMTFWPGLCYCPHCVARFKKEYGADLPRTVNWGESRWLKFQTARQSWLLDFARDCTRTAKLVRSEITVSHQFSTIFQNWAWGVPIEISEVCDYVGGDFYGGPAEHSLVCKAYHGLSRAKPFEFHTSRTRRFSDHVTMKPLPELRAEAFVATLHSAALMLVDYINIDGTLNHEVYRYLNRLSLERAAFEPFLGGDLLADVAIYFDKESVYNPLEDVVDVNELKDLDSCPHRDAVVGCARILQEGHIPFGVLTNANLRRDIEKFRALLVPNVLAMTPGQADIIRKFVSDGGVLYASGSTSLDRGESNPSFFLEDVLGARSIGVRDGIAYVTPIDPQLREAVWPQDHLSYSGITVLAEKLDDAEVLAGLTFPFVDPKLGTNIGSRFAAIHSNPPAIKVEEYPSAIINYYGKGAAVWASSPLEIKHDEQVNRNFVLTLMRCILKGPCSFEVDTHPAVEMVLLDQPEERRFIAGLLNLQREYPQIPTDATIRVLPPRDRSITKVQQLPAQKTIYFEEAGPYIQFKVEPFDVLALFSIRYD